MRRSLRSSLQVGVKVLDLHKRRSVRGVLTATVSPVVIRLPQPTSARTLPKPTDEETSYSKLSLYSQPSETVQELKLAVSEWVGGYWLGPYSLRLPGSNTEALSQSKDGVDVRAGEKLSEWLEVGDVFAHIESEAERELEVVKGKALTSAGTHLQSHTPRTQPDRPSFASSTISSQLAPPFIP